MRGLCLAGIIVQCVWALPNAAFAQPATKEDSVKELAYQKVWEPMIPDFIYSELAFDCGVRTLQWHASVENYLIDKIADASVRIWGREQAIVMEGSNQDAGVNAAEQATVYADSMPASACGGAGLTTRLPGLDTLAAKASKSQ